MTDNTDHRPTRPDDDLNRVFRAVRRLLAERPTLHGDVTLRFRNGKCLRTVETRLTERVA